MFACRTVLGTLARGVAGLPLAVVLAGPGLARAAAGKAHELHWYEADHAFANPTSARYDAEDTALAWRRTLAFFSAHLS